MTVREDVKAREEQTTAQTFQESKEKRYERLAQEYSMVGDTKKALKYYQNLVIIDKKDPQRWLRLAHFCLQEKRVVEADECIRKAFDLGCTGDERLDLMYSGLLI